ncbi:MAG: SRPBCC family protein [Micrococcales bacterium]|nr:SRPBCC family protein [Micrococcales bacterium]
MALSTPRRRSPLRTLAFAVGAAFAISRADKWQRSMGSTPAERDATLPGDNLVPAPRLESTRAIGVGAPPQAIWPWLLQMGQDKAGFYSIDRLERMIGLGIVSADEIVPEWQNLAVGDPVRLGPDVELRAAIVEESRALVLTPGDAPSPSKLLPTEFSWAFILEPEGVAGTRLVIRERYGWTAPGLAPWFRLVAAASGLMTAAMMRGIRRRAERR